MHRWLAQSNPRPGKVSRAPGQREGPSGAGPPLSGSGPSALRGQPSASAGPPLRTTSSERIFSIFMFAARRVIVASSSS